MNTHRFLFLSFLFLFNCAHSSSSVKAQKKSAQFLFTANEIKLLASNSCSDLICFDSITSISQYHNVIQTRLKKKPLTKLSQCLSFNFMGDSTKNCQQVTIEKIPKSYGIVATTIPEHSILIVSIIDANRVSLVGNEQYGSQVSANTLSQYIKRLFLNEPDTSRYGEKIVIFEFLDDHLNQINKYLSQLVIGYIDAQKEICRNVFHKDLELTSNPEIQKLKNFLPLRFDIRIRKTTAHR